MNIKPKTGRRNYAKGGMVEDDPNVMVNSQGYAVKEGTGGGWSPSDVGGVPGGPPDGGRYVTPPVQRPSDSMTQTEFNALVPGNPSLGSLANTRQAIRRWRKNSPNG